MTKEHNDQVNNSELIPSLNIIYEYVKKQEFADKLIKTEIAKRKDFQISNNRRGNLLISPEWNYALYGIGIRLENKNTGEIIEYDLGTESKIGGFNAGWICTHLKNSVNKEDSSSINNIKYWEEVLEKLNKKNLIERDKGDPIFGLYFLTNKCKEILQIEDFKKRLGALEENHD